MTSRSAGPTSTPARGRRARRAAAVLAALATAVALVALVSPGSASAAPRTAAAPDLGPNVRVYDPSMSVAEIRASVDAIYEEQVDNEMGTSRYTLLFKPGTYGTAEHPLIVQVGYYTEVAGLGALPTDVVINGHVDVYNRCLAPGQLHRPRTTSGGRCPTSRSTSMGLTAAARPATSGRRRRPRRCAGSTSSAAT